MIESIIKDLEKEQPREGCGILYSDKNQIYWAQIRNTAKDLQDFSLDKEQYLWYYTNYKIVGIVHSHVNQSSKPSNLDIINCNASGINYYIFSVPSGELTIVEPENKSISPLLSREYYFGVWDCFQLVKDYYSSTLGINIGPRPIFLNKWWEKDLDYFGEEYITSNFNFKKIDKLEKNCVVTFRVGPVKVANHCGIYTKDGFFLHHAHERLSVEEPLERIWRKSISGIYKYENINS